MKPPCAHSSQPPRLPVPQRGHPQPWEGMLRQETDLGANGGSALVVWEKECDDLGSPSSCHPPPCPPVLRAWAEAPLRVTADTLQARVPFSFCRRELNGLKAPTARSPHCPAGWKDPSRPSAPRPAGRSATALAGPVQRTCFQGRKIPESNSVLGSHFFLLTRKGKAAPGPPPSLTSCQRLCLVEAGEDRPGAPSPGLLMWP